MNGYMLIEVGDISQNEETEIIGVRDTLAAAIGQCPEAVWRTTELESGDCWFGTPSVFVVFDLSTYEVAAIGQVLI